MRWQMPVRMLLVVCFIFGRSFLPLRLGSPVVPFSFFFFSGGGGVLVPLESNQPKKGALIIIWLLGY